MIIDHGPNSGCCETEDQGRLFVLATACDDTKYLGRIIFRVSTEKILPGDAAVSLIADPSGEIVVSQALIGGVGT